MQIGKVSGSTPPETTETVSSEQCTVSRKELPIGGLPTETGGLAQLARAPALHAGGHRFDSDILHQIDGRFRMGGMTLLNLPN